MRRRSLLSLWLVSDLLLFIAIFTVAYFIRVGWILSSDLPVRQYVGIVTIASPIWLLSVIGTRTFGLNRSQKTLRSFCMLAASCVFGTALVALAYYFVYQQVFSRMILIVGFIVSTCVLWLWHLWFESLTRRSLRSDPPAFPTLIIGVTRESKRLIELLETRKHPLKPVAILDGAGAKEKDVMGVPVLGKLNKLEEVLVQHRITHLIQCSDLEQSINLLSACRNRGITYALLPSVLGIVEHDERIEMLEGRPVTMVSPGGAWWEWFFR